jgi:hypothetical protein
MPAERIMQSDDCAVKTVAHIMRLGVPHQVGILALINMPQRHSRARQAFIQHDTKKSHAAISMEMTSQSIDVSVVFVAYVVLSGVSARSLEHNTFHFVM